MNRFASVGLARKAQCVHSGERLVAMKATVAKWSLVLLRTHLLRPTEPLDPVARTGAASGEPIARVRQLTAIQRQATAPDTRRESRAQALQFGDPFINASRPPTR